jgi:branched-chain amino acid transport system permease protein
MPEDLHDATRVEAAAEVLTNRRDAATRRIEGLGTSIGILLVTVLAIVVVVVAPIGRNHLTLPLGLLLGVALLVVVQASTLFEKTSRNGRLLQVALLLGAAAFLVVFPVGRSKSTLLDLTLFAVFAIAVIGLNLSQGYAGQVSLAQAAFLGIGAYTSQLLDQGATVAWGPLKGTLPNLPFLASVAVAMIVTFLLSVLIGFPALRVQGPWLAFVTVAFNGLVVLVMNNQTALTNGPQGVRALRDNLNIFGVNMLSGRNYYYFCLTFLAVVTLFVWFVIRSPWGRAFKAIRDNPGRASSLGVSVSTYKLLAFAIGSMLAGLAGALFGPAVEFVDPTSFSVARSMSFLLASVVGGLGTLVGPFLGTAFITFLENHLRIFGDSYQVVFALFVIVMMVLSPKGIVGLARRIRTSVSARRGAR